MRRVILWMVIGAVISCSLIFGIQSIGRANDDTYLLSKQFDGVPIPVESYIQPKYVTDRNFTSIVDIFNDFEAHYQYGDDDFRLTNSNGEYIQLGANPDFWMTTKESETFRSKYNVLMADCDCAAIDAASRFIANGFPARVVIGTVSLYSDDDILIGTYQHAWVKVEDPKTAVWYLADMVIEKQLTALKPYEKSSENYHAYWEFDNNKHYWGTTAAFLFKYPEISSSEISELRKMYLSS